METIFSGAITLFLFLVGPAARTPIQDPTPWSDLAQAPEAHLARPLHLDLQFRAVEQAWEPFQTRFSPSVYVALECWGDEQILWNQAEFDAPAARVFVRRGGRLERLAGRLQPHDRIALRVVAHSAQLGQPWVEVVGMQRARATVPEGSVLHALKAIELMEQGAWDLARDQLARALAAPLPAHAEAALAGLAGRCEVALEARTTRRTTRSAAYRR